MKRAVKLLIGLAASLAAGWIWHGPLGQGGAMVDRLERQAREVVAKEEVPGIAVRLDRQPLARNATLSGEANDFQRNGMGSAPGLTGKVAAIEGMGAVLWADEPQQGRRALPLLAETLILAALAYLLGLGLGWFLWGRRRREGFA